MVRTMVGSMILAGSPPTVFSSLLLKLFLSPIQNVLTTDCIRSGGGGGGIERKKERRMNNYDCDKVKVSMMAATHRDSNSGAFGGGCKPTCDQIGLGIMNNSCLDGLLDHLWMI